MSLNKTLLVSMLVFCGIVLSGATFAQTLDTATSSDNATISNELEIENPRMLPDSPFYFLKEWGRGIQEFFTFDKIKKAELRQKIANEKLVELKKLSEKQVSQNVLERATEKYKIEVEKIKDVVDTFKDRAEDNPRVEKFLDKFTKQQLLQEEILQKIKEQVPTEVFGKIEEARQAHVEKFGEVMQKLEKADNMMKRIEGKIEERNKENNCPTMNRPTSDSCPNGEIKFLKDSNGCITDFKCITEQDNQIDDEDKCESVCLYIGTKSEGWYNPCTNELIKFANCGTSSDTSNDQDIDEDKCESVCLNVGTKSEGWYNSCTKELIRFTNCKPSPVSCAINSDGLETKQANCVPNYCADPNSEKRREVSQ